MKTGLLWKRSYIGFLVAVGLTNCARATAVTPTNIPEPSPTAEEPGKILIKDILYATVGNTETYLDLYLPRTPAPGPVVIFVHGSYQSSTDFFWLSKAIADQGALVYNINVLNTFPYIWKIKRIVCAVRFARATAAEYGGDPTQIILIGNSSGAATGIVAALAGEDFEGDCVENDTSPQVDVFIGYEGPYDYATTVYDPQTNHTKLKETDPELWNAINPYSYIGRNPELQIHLIHGRDVDTHWYDVPPEVSMELYDTLQDAGYDVELNFVEGANHTALTIQQSGGFEFIVQLVTDLTQNPSQ